MIRFQLFEKSFGAGPVLFIPDLSLPGGVYHIAGANGAGKTTLLKSVAGLIPFKGQIIVDGLDIRKQRVAYRLAVNYAEAEPLYPPFLTGTDLIHFYVQTKGGARDKVQELAERLGVEQYMHNRIDTYSSGMAKKLSLLLAFTGNPKLILLDEPLITLDPAAVNEITSIITEYQAAGTSLLITSHQALQLPVAVTTLSISNQTLVQ